MNMNIGLLDDIAELESAIKQLESNIGYDFINKYDILFSYPYHNEKPVAALEKEKARLIGVYGKNYENDREIYDRLKDLKEEYKRIEKKCKTVESRHLGLCVVFIIFLVSIIAAILNIYLP